MIIDNEEIFVLEYLKDKEKKLIYVPLRASLFLVSNKTAEMLVDKENSQERASIVAYLKTKKFIDIKKIHEAMLHAVPDLSISLTDDCNLACAYCHADAGIAEKNDNMSPENIAQIISHYFKMIDVHYSSCKQTRLTFMGGGEPTIRPRLMKYAIKLAKKEAIERQIHLIITTATNGCFSMEMADYILENFSHISLSFDGPKFIQDRQRPFRDGSGSFDNVYRAAKYFQKHNFSFAFRATISKFSLEHYKKIVDFFVTKFPKAFLGLEPLNLLGRGMGCKLNAPSTNEFAIGMEKIYKYAEGKAIKIGNANFGKFDLLRTIFCNAVAAPSFTVTPKGEIWACTRDGAPDIFRYGRFDFSAKRVELNHDHIKQLRNLNVFNFSECRNCFCKYHCAGDCPDLRCAGQLKCESTKQTGLYLLNKMIE